MAGPSTKIMQVSLPGPGKTQSYQLTADTPIKFTFDIAEAIFVGKDGNLQISVEGGGTVILENYQDLAGEGSLPAFELVDGEQVAGDVYLFAFANAEQTTDEALETAADGATGSSGAGEYSDDPGNIGDGIDALGGQQSAFGTHLFADALNENGNSAPIAVDDFNDILEQGDPDFDVEEHILMVDPDIVTTSFILPYQEEPGNGDYNGQYNGEFDGPRYEVLADPGPVDTPDGVLAFNSDGYSVNGMTISAGSAEDTAVLTLREGGVGVAEGAHDDSAIDNYGSEWLNLDFDLPQDMVTISLGNFNEYEYDEYASFVIKDAEGNVIDTVTFGPDDGSSFVLDYQSPIGSIEIRGAGESSDEIYSDFYLESVTSTVAATGGEGFYPLSDGRGFYINYPAPDQPDGSVEGNLIENDFDPDGDDSLLTMKSIDFLGTDFNGETLPPVEVTELGATVAGRYGTLEIDDLGNYTYTLHEEYANLLEEGEVVEEVFVYTIEDPLGAESNEARLVVTVTGSNDMPVAFVDTSSDAVEVGNSSSFQLGQFPDHDYTSIVPAHGNVLTNDTDIDDDVLPDNAESEVKVIGVYSHGSMTTDSIDPHYTPGDTDDTVDYGSDFALTVTGTYGTLELGTDGEYTYTPDQPAADTLNYLNPGTETFTYAILDDSGAFSYSTLTFTVNGANDAPEATDDTSEVIEFGEEHLQMLFQEMDILPPVSDVSGNVLDNDTDVDDTDIFVGSISSDLTGDSGNPYVDGDIYNGEDQGPITIEGRWGTLTMEADGDYTYVLNDQNGEVDALNYGDTLTETFTYTARNSYADGLNPDDDPETEATLSITIKGTNDAPVAVPDIPLDDGGELAYAVEAGDHHDEKPDMHELDGPDVPAVTVGGNVLLNDTDVDNVDYPETDGTSTELFVVSAGYGTYEPGDTGLQSVGDGTIEIKGTYGTLTIGKDGTYTYDPDQPAVEALNNGDLSEPEIFTYEVSDPWGATRTTTLTITIQGTNDAPIAQLDDAHTMLEMVTLNAEYGFEMAGISFKPFLNGEELSADHLVDSPWGLGINSGDDRLRIAEFSNGSYDDPAIDNSGGTESLLIEFDAPQTDITITLGSWESIDDGTAITYGLNGDELGQFKFHGDNGTEDGILNLTSADFGGFIGSVLISSEGNPSDPTPNDFFIESIQARVSTETGDAKEDGTLTNGDIYEDATLATGNALLNDTDIDNVDYSDPDYDATELSVVGIISDETGASGEVDDGTTSISGQYGTLTIQADGTYVYTPDQPDAQALNVGDSATETFTYTISDNEPGVELHDTATLSFTVVGTNDAPVARPDTVHDATVNPEGELFGALVEVSANADNNFDAQGIHFSPYSTSDPAQLDFTQYGLGIRNANENPGNDNPIDNGGSTDWIQVDFDIPQVFVQVSFSQFNEGSEIQDDVTIVVHDVNGEELTSIDFGKAFDSADDVFTLSASEAGGLIGALEIYPTRDGDGSTNDFFIESVTGTALNTVSQEGGFNPSEAGTSDYPFDPFIPPSDVTGNVLTNDFDIDNVDQADIDADPLLYQADLDLSVISVTSDKTGDSGVDLDFLGAGTVVQGQYGMLYIQSNGVYVYKPMGSEVDQLNVDDEPVVERFTYTISDNNDDTPLESTSYIEFRVEGTNDGPNAVFDGIFTVQTALATATASMENDFMVDGITFTPLSTSEPAELDHTEHGLGIKNANENPNNDNPIDDGGSTDSMLIGFDVPQNDVTITLAEWGATDDATITVMGVDGQPLADTFIIHGDVNEFDGILEFASSDYGAPIGSILISAQGNPGDPTTNTFYIESVEATVDSGQETIANTIFGPLHGVAVEEGHIHGQPDIPTDDLAPVNVMGNALLNDTDVDNDDFIHEGSTELSVLAAGPAWAFDGPPLPADGPDIGLQRIGPPGPGLLIPGDTASDGTTMPLGMEEVESQGLSIQGRYGTLFIQQDGEYTYTLNTLLSDQLNEGQIVYDRFSYLISDNQAGNEMHDTSSIEITIKGTNDDAYIFGDSSGLITEGPDHGEGTLLAEGWLTAIDVDSWDPDGFQIQTGTESQVFETGRFSITADGHWTFTVSNEESQRLDDDFEPSEEFVVKSADGTEHTVTIDTAGLNDAPVANADQVAVSTVVANIDNGFDVPGILFTPLATGNNPELDLTYQDEGLGVRDTNEMGSEELKNSIDGSGDKNGVLIEFADDADSVSVEFNNYTGQDDLNVTVRFSDGTSDYFEIRAANNIDNGDGTGSLYLSYGTEIESVEIWSTDSTDSFFISSVTASDGPILEAQTDPVVIQIADLLANDFDVDALDTIEFVEIVPGTVQGGTAEVIDGAIYFHVDADTNQLNGPTLFQYEITDGDATARATVNLDVLPVNDAPVAGNDTAMVYEDSSVTINVLSNDFDVDTGDTPPDSFSIVSVGNADHGSVEIVNTPFGQQIKYTPNADADTDDSFTYTIRDSFGAESSATVNVDVIPLNDPPVAYDDTFGNITPTVVTDLDASAFTEANNWSAGGVTLSASSTLNDVIRIVTEDGIGILSHNDIGYSAEDTTIDGWFDETLTMRFNAPQTTVTLTLGENDDFHDNPQFVVRDSSGGIINGNWTIDGDEYTFSANDIRSVEVSANHIAEDFTITSIHSETAPQADYWEDGGPIHLAVSDIVYNDFDQEGDALTIQLVAGSEMGGTAQLSTDGTEVIFTPDANFNGTATFQYYADDGQDISLAPANVAINIAPTPDAPTATADIDGSTILFTPAFDIVGETAPIDVSHFTTANLDTTGTDDYVGNGFRISANGDVSVRGNGTGLGVHQPLDDSNMIDGWGNEWINIQFDSPQDTVELSFDSYNNNNEFAFIHAFSGDTWLGQFYVDGNDIVDISGSGVNNITSVTVQVYGNNDRIWLDGIKASPGVAPIDHVDRSLLVDYSMHAMAVAAGNVLANDFDIDGDSLEVSNIMVQGDVSSSTEVDGSHTIVGDYGELTIYDNGNYEYNPNTDWVQSKGPGTETFIYEVSDDTGLTDTATLSFDIQHATPTYGTENADILNGSDMSETFFGLAGDDVILASGGYDIIYASSGNDTVTLGEGADTILIDSDYIGTSGGSMLVNDFHVDEGDGFALTDELFSGGAVTVDIDTTNGTDIELVFNDINGTGDLTITLAGVLPATDTIDGSIEITNSAQLNDLIQSIIDSPDTSLVQ